MDNGHNDTVHLTTSSAPKRFVPTCTICGNQHWPRDPSCAGKKGAKAKAKGVAKATAPDVNSAGCMRLAGGDNQPLHTPFGENRCHGLVIPPMSPSNMGVVGSGGVTILVNSVMRYLSPLVQMLQVCHDLQELLPLI